MAKKTKKAKPVGYTTAMRNRDAKKAQAKPKVQRAFGGHVPAGFGAHDK